MSLALALVLILLAAAFGFGAGLWVLLRRGDIVWARQAQRDMEQVVHAWAEREVVPVKLVVREDSSDLAIVFDVLGRNEYRLPERFGPTDIVIDIGAHIGSFSFAALARGCAEVHAFEPNGDNLALARKNLERYGNRAVLYETAVWRSDSDSKNARLTLQPPPEPGNHGGTGVAGEGGGDVEPVSFDDLLRELTRGGERQIRLIKLDCEGSEYPILLTSKMLHLVDEMTGEYHVLPAESFAACPDLASQCNPERLRVVLEEQGFEVEMTPPDPWGLGHFSVRRSR